MSDQPQTKGPSSFLKSPGHWLFIAAAFHVLITLLVYLSGVYRLFPNVFDQNGIGTAFAPDGLSYQQLAAALADALRRGDIRTWLDIPAPFHCRLYSLPFAFPGSIVGYNILAAEPLNLVYYLAILGLAYLLGKELFDSRAGIGAAALIAIWPTFVVHSTQLLRDPVAIVSLLGLLLTLTRIVGEPMRGRVAWFGAIGGVASVTLFWMIRGNMLNLVLAALGITAFLFTIGVVRRRGVPLTNFAILVILLGAVLFVPSRLESTTLEGSVPPTSLIDLTGPRAGSSHNLWQRFIRQISVRRGSFEGYQGKGSNLDTDVRFGGLSDLIRYLPRATEIGLFAPFPRMWVSPGSTGRLARLAAGGETLIMYLLYLPAAACVWSTRRNLKMWLTFGLALVSMIGLGLVVANVGALFRLRYGFWIMVIVLAAKGIEDVRGAYK